jgi:predicted transcriptional regulator
MLMANEMVKFELPGVPAGGLRRVGQRNNTLTLRVGQNGMVVALELLSSRMHGAPVVDERDEFMGFISVFDVLHALEAGKIFPC